jgi:hypothetical protein
MKFSFKRISRKGLVFGASAGVALGLTGAALAFFTSTGSGTGQGSVGSATNWTVTAAAVTGGPIYPGQGTEHIPFTITNAGSGNQALQTAVASVNSGTGGAITQAGVAVPGCLAADFTATAGAPTPAFGTSIIPTGTASVSVAVTMTDTAVSQNACQGKTPDINLNVT